MDDREIICYVNYMHNREVAYLLLYKTFHPRTMVTKIHVFHGNELTQLALEIHLKNIVLFTIAFPLELKC